MAVVGIGEVGSESDAETVTPLLTAQMPRVRSRAVATYGRLAGRPATGEPLNALHDESPRVARSASQALVRLGVSTDMLDAAWTTSLHKPASLLATFRLFVNAGRWRQRRISLMSVAIENDEDLNNRGLALFDACMASWNRSATSPPPNLAGDVVALLARAAGSLGQRRYEIASISLRPYLPAQVTTETS